MVLGLARAGTYVVATSARERTEIEAVAEEVQRDCGEARVFPVLAEDSEGNFMRRCTSSRVGTQLVAG
jgi:hypothetical protein